MEIVKTNVTQNILL